MIYLDNAATTQMAEEVLDKMLPYLTRYYGNPSGIYRLAALSKTAVEEARHETAALIGAKDSEIYFTSGGSESDNWALKAAVESGRGNHIITDKAEHHAVINTAKYLERMGVSVTFLDVDPFGRVDPQAVERAIRPDTALVSVMYANNEVGTILPIREIGRICRRKNVLFHTDAVQAYGHVPIDVNDCCIDMLSASAHKLEGPKGTGLLYIRDGVRMGAFVHGGHQERSRRAGTLNVAGIVGFGEAARLARENMAGRIEYERELRDYIMAMIEREIPCAMLNGHRTQRLPNNINFSFRHVQGESVLIMLDMRGICASSGSACTSGSADPSGVLLAMGRSRDEAYGAVRMTISHRNTRAEANEAVRALSEAVARLRQARV